MKKKSFILTAIVLATAAFGLSSCLKDDSHFTDFSNVGSLIELPLEAFNGPGALVPEALPISNTPQTIPVVVNLASPKTLSTATSVTLAVDQASLDAYNTANSTSYTMLPAADYSISSLTVTIPAGQREATLKVNVNTNLIDLNQQYVLPLKITNASGVKISNYNTLLLNVQAKNKYDGHYVVTGSLVDVVSGSLTGYYPMDIYLETTGANSDAWYDPDNGYAHLILSGGACCSYYGSFSPVFTFDPATNNVTSVVNHYGQPAPSNTRSARIDPSGANTFTGTPGSAGSVLNVKYIMVQTSAGGDRTFFNETFTYQGPRP